MTVADWIDIVLVLGVATLLVAVGFVAGAIWQNAKWRRLIKSVSVRTTPPTDRDR